MNTFVGGRAEGEDGGNRIGGIDTVNIVDISVSMGLILGGVSIVQKAVVVVMGPVYCEER